MDVILDVIEDAPIWADWSQDQWDRAALNDVLIINPVVYAGLSIAFYRIKELEAGLARRRIDRRADPPEALCLAGKSFLQYRRQKAPGRASFRIFSAGHTRLFPESHC